MPFDPARLLRRSWKDNPDALAYELYLMLSNVPGAAAPIGRPSAPRLPLAPGPRKPLPLTPAEIAIVRGQPAPTHRVTTLVTGGTLPQRTQPPPVGRKTVDDFVADIREQFNREFPDQKPSPQVAPDLDAAAKRIIAANTEHLARLGDTAAVRPPTPAIQPRALTPEGTAQLREIRQRERQVRVTPTAAEPIEPPAQRVVQPPLTLPQAPPAPVAPTPTPAERAGSLASPLEMILRDRFAEEGIAVSPTDAPFTIDHVFPPDSTVVQPPTTRKHEIPDDVRPEPRPTYGERILQLGYIGAEGIPGCRQQGSSTQPTFLPGQGTTTLYDFDPDDQGLTRDSGEELTVFNYSPLPISGSQMWPLFVMLDSLWAQPPTACHAIVASAIQPCSGTTPGTGTATTYYTSNGSVVSDQTLDVKSWYNVTAASGKHCTLMWVEASGSLEVLDC